LVTSDQPPTVAVDRASDKRLSLLLSKAADHVTSDTDEEAEYGRQSERSLHAFDWRLVKECGDHQEGSDYDKTRACQLKDPSPGLATMCEVSSQSQVYQSGEKDVYVTRSKHHTRSIIKFAHRRMMEIHILSRKEEDDQES
jgi:hypothetical protein